MRSSVYSPPKRRAWYISIGVLVWLANLADILLRFRSMHFVPALVAGMCFLLIPLELWREWYGV